MPIKEVYKITQKIQDFILLINGKILKKEYWGLRFLAYIIKNNKKGHYIFLKININPQLISLIKKELIIYQSIIKFLIIKIESNNLLNIAK